MDEKGTGQDKTSDGSADIQNEETTQANKSDNLDKSSLDKHKEKLKSFIGSVKEKESVKELMDTVKDKEKLKGLFGSLKGSVEKSIGDITKKKKTEASENSAESGDNPVPNQGTSSSQTSAEKPSSEQTAAQSTKPAAQKPQTDYVEMLRGGLGQASKMAKEMMALAMNKEIDIDYSKIDKAKLMTVEQFQSEVKVLSLHLEAYQHAKQAEDKQSIATTRAACKQDEALIKSMIKDIEIELMRIHRDLQSDEGFQEAKAHFKLITKEKWRPLVHIKEEDTDAAFGASADFDDKFSHLLSLNAAINQAIHSSESSSSEDTDDASEQA